MKTIKKYFIERSKSKVFFAIIALYILFCLSSSIYWAIGMQMRNFWMSLAFIVFVPMLLMAECIMDFRCGEIFTTSILFLAAGSILGTCFNFYTAIPFFDTILHGMSGILFACLGFTLSEKFFGRHNSSLSFFGCVVFGFCFSLAIAVAWEIFEYSCTVFLGFDMMEDAIVHDINSYLLAGSHAETVTLNDITQTIIYYGDKKMYVLNGYLDLGLIDTLADMIICTVGAIVFVITSVLSYKYFPKINNLLIPQLKTRN